MTLNWRPRATLDTLRQRAQLTAVIRQFFLARGVLEVETPALLPTTATDIYIDSFRVASDSEPALFLQTSPEFPLKRLLAAGSGPLYQLGKVFRREAPSKRHSPEFTMLEWYRPDFSLEQLMDEVEALVSLVFSSVPQLCNENSFVATRYSYRELFEQHLGVDPHRAGDDAIAKLVEEQVELVADGLSRTDNLQLLLGHCLEPLLPPVCFLYDYPVAQCALAQIAQDERGESVARRFELFVNGMELANGYHELRDATEQRARFSADIAERARRGAEPVPLDEALLAALTHGLPDCSGVALGVDRLLMAALGKDEIGDVLSF